MHSPQADLTLKHKAMVYVTWGEKFLVFTQPQFPEAGIQVVAGTVAQGETPEQAAIRELHEEAGISAVKYISLLGSYQYSMLRYGKAEVHQRHVFHVQINAQEVMPANWLHEEHHADTGEAAILFSFFWMELHQVQGRLIAGHDDFLPILMHGYEKNSR